MLAVCVYVCIHTCVYFPEHIFSAAADVWVVN